MDTPNDSATPIKAEQWEEWVRRTCGCYSCGGGNVNVAQHQLQALLNEKAAALTRVAELERDRKAVVDMIRNAELESGFDQADEDIELKRLVISWHQRAWDYWKQKHEEQTKALRLAEQQRDEARAEAVETKRKFLDGSFKPYPVQVEALTKERDEVRAQLHRATERENALREALRFYGPEGDFDLGDYELKITEDSGDIARAALEATAPQPNAVTDAQRLDWLESNWEKVFQRIGHDGIWYWDTKDQTRKRADSFRQAIDQTSAALSTDTGGGRG